LWRRFSRYGGRPEPNALNVIVESLKLIQESVVSMCKCQSTMFELVYLVCKMGRKRLAEFPIIIIETYIQ